MINAVAYVRVFQFILVYNRFSSYSSDPDKFFIVNFIFRTFLTKILVFLNKTVYIS